MRITPNKSIRLFQCWEDSHEGPLVIDRINLNSRKPYSFHIITFYRKLDPATKSSNLPVEVVYFLLCHFYLLTERIKKTVEIKQSTIEIEEKGVRLKLTVVDTPGFGDSVNSDKRYFYQLHFHTFLAIIDWMIGARKLYDEMASG